MTHVWSVIGLLLIAAAAFVGGVYYVASGAPLPGFVVVHPQPSAQVASLSGTLIAHSQTAITVSFPDGTTQNVAVGPSTQVLKVPSPVPAQESDLRSGASVVVLYQQGQPAQMVQILPSNN